MSHEQAFIDAICERPHDDQPRLIYADWMEENGDADRGEFIRLQVAIDNAPLAPNNRYLLYRDWERLRERELELLSEPRNYVNWVPLFLHQGSMVGIRCVNPPAIEITGSDCKQLEFQRGLIGMVECTHDFWCGSPCEWCNGGGRNIITEAVIKPCRYCHGSGRINANGPAIVACQPVTRVRLSIPIGRLQDAAASYGFTGQIFDTTDFCALALTWARREARLPELEAVRT